MEHLASEDKSIIYKMLGFNLSLLNLKVEVIVINGVDDEFIVSFILNNTFLFSVLFGTLGGLVHAIDTTMALKIGEVIKKIIISISASILVFFISYDIKTISPAYRIVCSFIAGFLGVIIFRSLSNAYLKYIQKNFKLFEIEPVVDESSKKGEDTQNNDRSRRKS